MGKPLKRDARPKPASPASVRVLELFFAVFESRDGLLQREIHRLPHYRYLEDDHSFNVMLGRDLDQLRQLGVVFQTDTVTIDGVHHKRYRVDSSTVLSGAQHTLEPVHLQLLHMALAAATSLDADRFQAIDTTLRATTDEAIPAKPRTPRPLVEDIEGAGVLLQALREEIPVSFSYASATCVDIRAVEPWRLLIRGHGMYLWGWDLDRRAPRLFRLSRIESGIDLVGEPGDCDHPMPEDVDPFAGYSVSPRLLVRRGADLDFATDLTPESGLDRGEWEGFVGAPEETHVWLDRIVAHAADVVLLEPRDLAQRLVTAFDYARRGAPHA